MLKCKILSIGKPKESWLQEAIKEYTMRLGPIMSIEWLLARDNHQLTLWLEKEPCYFGLDPKGKQFTSKEFSTWIQDKSVERGSRLSIVIGGAEGLTDEMRKKASEIISFSKLTFTHQLTRVVLLEQLYRAFEIARGSKYHK